MRGCEKVEVSVDDDEYQDYLTEVYDKVNVCGNVYDAGHVLREFDPVAFRCSKADFESELPPKWECTECGEIYDREDAASECCGECKSNQEE